MDVELKEGFEEPLPDDIASGEMPKSIEIQSKKLSWSELKAVVGELRRQLSNLSTMIPSSFNFRTLQDGRTRIYFLSTLHNGWFSIFFKYGLEDFKYNLMQGGRIHFYSLTYPIQCSQVVCGFNGSVSWSFHAFLHVAGKRLIIL